MSGLIEGATLRPSGEAAFVVEFADRIDPVASGRVTRLAAAFDNLAPDGLIEVVPTFRSLLVLFDPDKTSRDALLKTLPAEAPSTVRQPKEWRLPVAMEGEAAEDIEAAASGLQMTATALREAFLAGRYQVGMYGFAPGFAYLSGVADSLAIPRRASPRSPMPAGSLILAGGMAALTSISMPTGWYVIGRTAITLFRPGATPMVPFDVGDTICFEVVSQTDLAHLAKDADGGLREAAP